MFEASDGTMGRMEIITGRERRRRWSDDEKLRILEQASSPDVSAAEVARRHDILPQQVYTWRRQFRAAHPVSSETISFLPLGVMADDAASITGRTDQDRPHQWTDIMDRRRHR